MLCVIKKSILKSLLIIIFITSFLVVGCTSGSKEEDLYDCKASLTLYPDKVPTDFFIDYESWQYDVNDFAFDSREGKLRKVISFEGAFIDTTLNLTEDERKEVWRLMKEINILSYPTQYEPESWGSMSHAPNYNLTLGYNGLTKNIKWNKNTETYACDEAHNLKMVMTALDSIITNKKEYQGIGRQRGL